MPNKTILVVDDDESLLELVAYNLRAEGHIVVTARDGQEGLRQFHNSQPHLVILDVTMPKLNGFDVCQRIREMADTPIVMLTAQGREDDIIRGLDLGADEYVTKPFHLRAFMARVRASLRRAEMSPVQEQRLAYRDEHLSIDLDARRIAVQGERVKLSPTEFRLLSLLVKNKGRLLEFRQILEQVWGVEYIDDIDYLRVYVWHLRKKIEPDPRHPVYLLNELNTGYRFEPRSV